MISVYLSPYFFFFNDTATTEIYTLSLHDALPISYVTLEPCSHQGRTGPCCDALIAAGVAKVVGALTDPNPQVAGQGDRKSTRLNSSHLGISYAVFCLKKKRRSTGKNNHSTLAPAY